MEWRRDHYLLSDDNTRLDLDVICSLLATTYWAANRSREVMEEAVRHSLCLGLFHHERQVGFARAVTDHATFTWLCDVIVHPGHRGSGIGKWMVERLTQHPAIQTRQLLITRDAHTLYERFGFERKEAMIRLLPTAVKGDAVSTVL